MRAASLLLLVLIAACADTPEELVEKAESLGPVGPARPVTGEPAPVAGITDAHNRVRARVGVPPLQWSPVLAEIAQRWANACVDDEPPRGMIDHSPAPSHGNPEPIGENLYATTGSVADPLVAVQSWASEAVFFDARRNECDGGVCGHYTQIVWATTREVGCGVGSCPNLQFSATLVCNYRPAGNIVGQRPYP